MSAHPDAFERASARIERHFSLSFYIGLKIAGQSSRPAAG
ncbi:hypothetical protein HMPREF0262_02487 [Clostridium sp. ATCC 29733]|nr:hypothetical protein HMPREF0262_02487 [Clostridium sp. ATCC 29733]